MTEPRATSADAAGGAAVETQRCPQCAAALAGHDRFPVWCPACEWNLIPSKRADPARSKRERRRAVRAERRTESRRRAVRARTEQVFELVAAGGSNFRDRSVAAAFALAGLVHLVSLGVLLLALGLVSGLLLPGWPGPVLGVIGLCVAFALRPRLGRPERGPNVLARESAPALYALADRTAAALGTAPVDLIAVDGAFNAGFGVLGLRRRRQLVIGLPLWATLTRQQKVALLGHEFGHGVNRDNRRSLWTGSAVRALEEWSLLTRPGRVDTRGNLMVVAAAAAAALLLWVVHQGVLGLTELMHRLNLRSGQAAEYRADRLAAGLTSVADTRGMLTGILHSSTVETVILRQRALPRPRPGRTGQPAAPDLWQSLAEATRSIPPIEVERRLRLSERELGAVDGSHPPTHLRLRMLATAPPPPSDRHPVVLDAAEDAAIEAELAGHRERIARDLL